MAKRASRDMTVEEYDAWAAAGKRVDAVADSADEQGGPSLSLVPVVDQQEPWPTDLLPPIPPRNGRSGPEGSAGSQEPVECLRREGEPMSRHAGGMPEANWPEAGGGADLATSSGDSSAPVLALPFDGIPLEDSRKRLAGWSAERQRVFLCHLAETGSVHLACRAARLSARGAYRLRARSPAFARAWDVAQQLAVGRLSALAFDRAIHGRVEQVYHGGELVGERRVPSDKLLMWLLARLDPRRFALPWEQRGDTDPQAEAVAAFPALLEAVTDTPA